MKAFAKWADSRDMLVDASKVPEGQSIYGHNDRAFVGLILMVLDGPREHVALVLWSML